MPHGITKLEISRYEQISSSRPLENAYYNATKGKGSYGEGETCEIEIENKLFVRGSGDLYVASDALVDWYYKACFNSLADDIVIIIDHDRKYARVDSDPEQPDREPPNLQDFPKAYVPPPDDRRKMHKQIREHTNELTELLDELDKLQDDQPIKMNKVEIEMVNTVAEIAKITKSLFEPDLV